MIVMLYGSEAKVEASSTETRAVTSPVSSCPPLRRQMPDAFGAGDDHLRCQPEKQTVLDDAGPRVKLGGQRRRPLDRAEDAVEDQVPLIGPERRPIVLLSHGDAGAQGLEETPLRMPPEWDDLHRQRPVSAERR